MIKRLIAMILAAMLALSLAACGGQSSSSEPEAPPAAVNFSATVLEENETSITVRPDENTDAYKSADQIVVSLKDVPITEADGTAITVLDLNAGDTVDISYDGYILESYPAQINSCTAVVRTANNSDGSATEIHKDEENAAFSIEAGEMPDPDSYAEVYSQPDFTEAAGFAVSELPDLAANDITYDMDYLIDGSVAELKFTVEGNFPMFLRIAVAHPDGRQDISGVLGNFEEDVTEEIGGVTVRTRASAAGPAVKNWSKDGYLFSIYFPHNTMSMAGGVTQLFIDSLTLNPAQAPAA